MSNTNAMVKTENYNDLEDTAMFKIVNQHSEKAREQRMQEEYEAEVARMKAAEEVDNRIKMAKRSVVLSMVKYFFLALSIALFMWMFVSWINVVSHNTQPGGYDLIWSWNFFKVFFKP